MPQKISYKACRRYHGRKINQNLRFKVIYYILYVVFLLPVQKALSNDHLLVQESQINFFPFQDYYQLPLEGGSAKEGPLVPLSTVHRNKGISGGLLGELFEGVVEILSELSFSRDQMEEGDLNLIRTDRVTVLEADIRDAVYYVSDADADQSFIVSGLVDRILTFRNQEQDDLEKKYPSLFAGQKNAVEHKMQFQILDRWPDLYRSGAIQHIADRQSEHIFTVPELQASLPVRQQAIDPVKGDGSAREIPDGSGTDDRVSQACGGEGGTDSGEGLKNMDVGDGAGSNFNSEELSRISDIKSVQCAGCKCEKVVKDAYFITARGTLCSRCTVRDLFIDIVLENFSVNLNGAEVIFTRLLPVSHEIYQIDSFDLLVTRNFKDITFGFRRYLNAILNNFDRLPEPHVKKMKCLKQLGVYDRLSICVPELQSGTNVRVNSVRRVLSLCMDYRPLLTITFSEAPCNVKLTKSDSEMVVTKYNVNCLSLNGYLRLHGANMADQLGWLARAPAEKRTNDEITKVELDGLATLRDAEELLRKLNIEDLPDITKKLIEEMGIQLGTLEFQLKIDVNHLHSALGEEVGMSSFSLSDPASSTSLVSGQLKRNKKNSPDYYKNILQSILMGYFEIHDVPGDGDCFYQALSEAIQNSPSVLEKFNEAFFLLMMPKVEVDLKEAVSKTRVKDYIKSWIIAVYDVVLNDKNLRNGQKDKYLNGLACLLGMSVDSFSTLKRTGQLFSSENDQSHWGWSELLFPLSFGTGINFFTLVPNKFYTSIDEHGYRLKEGRGISNDLVKYLESQHIMAKPECDRTQSIYLLILSMGRKSEEILNHYNWCKGKPEFLKKRALLAFLEEFEERPINSLDDQYGFVEVGSTRPTEGDTVYNPTLLGEIATGRVKSNEDEQPNNVPDIKKNKRKKNKRKNNKRKNNKGGFAVEKLKTGEQRAGIFDISMETVVEVIAAVNVDLAKMTEVTEKKVGSTQKESLATTLADVVRVESRVDAMEKGAVLHKESQLKVQATEIRAEVTLKKALETKVKQPGYLNPKVAVEISLSTPDDLVRHVLEGLHGDTRRINEKQMSLLALAESEGSYAASCFLGLIKANQLIALKNSDENTVLSRILVHEIIDNFVKVSLTKEPVGVLLLYWFSSQTGSPEALNRVVQLIEEKYYSPVEDLEPSLSSEIFDQLVPSARNIRRSLIRQANNMYRILLPERAFNWEDFQKIYPTHLEIEGSLTPALLFHSRHSQERNPLFSGQDFDSHSLMLWETTLSLYHRGLLLRGNPEMSVDCLFRSFLGFWELSQRNIKLPRLAQAIGFHGLCNGARILHALYIDKQYGLKPLPWVFQNWDHSLDAIFHRIMQLGSLHSYYTYLGWPGIETPYAQSKVPHFITYWSIIKSIGWRFPENHELCIHELCQLSTYMQINRRLEEKSFVPHFLRGRYTTVQAQPAQRTEPTALTVQPVGVEAVQPSPASQSSSRKEITKMVRIGSSTQNWVTYSRREASTHKLQYNVWLTEQLKKINTELVRLSEPGSEPPKERIQLAQNLLDQVISTYDEYVNLSRQLEQKAKDGCEKDTALRVSKLMTIVQNSLVDNGVSIDVVSIVKKFIDQLIPFVGKQIVDKKYTDFLKGDKKAIKEYVNTYLFFVGLEFSGERLCSIEYLVQIGKFIDFMEKQNIYPDEKILSELLGFFDDHIRQSRITNIDSLLETIISLGCIEKWFSNYNVFLNKMIDMGEYIAEQLQVHLMNLDDESRDIVLKRIYNVFHNGRNGIIEQGIQNHIKSNIINLKAVLNDDFSGQEEKAKKTFKELLKEETRLTKEKESKRAELLSLMVKKMATIGHEGEEEFDEKDDQEVLGAVLSSEQTQVTVEEFYLRSWEALNKLSYDEALALLDLLDKENEDGLWEARSAILRAEVNLRLFLNGKRKSAFSDEISRLKERVLTYREIFQQTNQQNELSQREVFQFPSVREQQVMELARDIIILLDVEDGDKYLDNTLVAQKRALDLLLKEIKEGFYDTDSLDSEYHQFITEYSCLKKQHQQLNQDVKKLTSLYPILLEVLTLRDTMLSRYYRSYPGPFNQRKSLVEARPWLFLRDHKITKAFIKKEQQRLFRLSEQVEELGQHLQ